MVGKSKTVTSLQSRRKDKNRIARKGFLPLEQRLSELEDDLFRLIEFSLEQEERINSQSALIRRMVQLLRRRQRKASSSSSGQTSAGEDQESE